MSNIRSYSLWRGGNGATPGDFTGPGPPAGYIWLVRGVSLYNEEIYGNLGGIRMSIDAFDLGELPLFTLTNKSIQQQELYEWRTRRVMTEFDTLYAHCLDGFWTWDVTGWALTTP